jgi:membrane fusion protein, macrolide-specific efflux system
MVSIKKMRWTTITLWTVCIVIVGFIVFSFVVPKPANNDAASQKAELSDIERTVLATGTLEPYTLVSVGARATGQVTSLKVEVGQTVAKGTLIAEIDSATQTNDLLNAQAKLDDVRSQKISAEASLAQARNEFERQQQLFKADAGSQADYEAALKTFASAKASLTSIEAQIRQSQISVKTSQVNRGYTRILAPINGTVLTIVTKEGQTVNAVQAAPVIIKMGRLDKMIVKAQISEADVINVKAGQEVYFTILGDPDKRYYARLKSIEPAPTTFSSDNGTTTSNSSSAIYYYGRFEVDNPQGVLRTSMTANVHVVLQGVKNALTIPASALREHNPDGSYQVMVLTDGKPTPQSRRITVGINDGAKVQVNSGLQPGESVLIVDANAANAAKSNAGAGPGGGRPGPPNQGGR